MPTTPHLTRAFQWDLARQVERLDFLLKWLPRYAEWGYEELYLHLEDAVEYPSLPGVARRDAYSYRQFVRLVEAATAAGIRVVPIVNLLGHTQYLIKTPELRDLNELRDAVGAPLDRGQVCPLHPRTREVAEKLLRDMAPFCTASKVHVGLDESFHLGKCPRCRADVERRGLAAHFAGHVRQLHELTTGLGLRMGMWADMLALLPAAIPLLPTDVIAYDWYYYPFARHPRVELRNFAEVDLATPLRKRGIEYWGCPMNGAFRHEPLPVFGDRLGNILSWWKRCRRVGAGGFLVTSWEADRLAIEMATAVDAAAACLWLEPGIEEPLQMLARGFARVFGGSDAGTAKSVGMATSRLADMSGTPMPHGTTTSASSVRRMATADMGGTPGSLREPQLRSAGTIANLGKPAAAFTIWARTALAGDHHAFAGYHRWQINDRWDVCLARDGVAPYEKELREVQTLCRAGSPNPAASRIGKDEATGALTASLAFRLYLAQRDVFVRRAAEGVFQIRQMLGPSQKAAAGASKQPMDAKSLARVRGHQKRLAAEAAAFAAALDTGRDAARAMWRRSRDPCISGPNEKMLQRDAARLGEWRRWLGQSERNPALVFLATPVCGEWQLWFTVHNFAPAMQKLVVEQRSADGAWKELYGLHTIEFRAAAAMSRTRIRREFSVPIVAGLGEAGTGTTDPGTIALRIAVRGVGQVAISRIELTDGVSRLRSRSRASAAKRILGCPALRRGFPIVDFRTNAATVEFRF